MVRADEEARARAFRAQERERARAETARERSLAGSESAAEANRRNWAPVLLARVEAEAAAPERDE